MEKYLTVAQLTKYLKFKLENDQHLKEILLKGEISNFKHHSRGHLYFSLKDAEATISCVMFAGDANQLNFKPKEGMQVLVEGKISLYMPSGQYSIQITKMSPDGIGDLYLKYEQLKNELSEKGYFSDTYKKPIPKFPKVIGVITSKTGAVIEDIKNTVSRRYMLSEIYLYPTAVQGVEAISSIVKNIKKANEDMIADVLIVGRGGGSIEDLWAFNSLEVVMAIFESKIPIITAIGHETDYTISDFVSDLRAPTPTAAAELATPNKIDLLDYLTKYRKDIKYKTNTLVKEKQTLLMHLDSRLDLQSPEHKLNENFKKLNDVNIQLNQKIKNYLQYKKLILNNQIALLKSPKDKIKQYETIYNHLRKNLNTSITKVIENKRYQFNVLKETLNAQSPLKLMDKGYAIVKSKQGVIKTVKNLKLEDDIEISLKDGNVIAKIKEIR